MDDKNQTIPSSANTPAVNLRPPRRGQYWMGLLLFVLSSFVLGFVALFTFVGELSRNRLPSPNLLWGLLCSLPLIGIYGMGAGLGIRGFGTAQPDRSWFAAKIILMCAAVVFGSLVVLCSVGYAFLIAITPSTQ